MNTIDGNEPPCPTHRHVPLAAATITAAGPTALAAASLTAATEPVAAVAPSLASNHSAFATSTAAAARAARGLLAAGV